MLGLVMLCFFGATVLGVITSYFRATPREGYRPIPGAHWPPLVVGAVCVPIAIVYVILRVFTLRKFMVDVAFLPVALLGMLVSLVFTRYNPVSGRR